ncbi:MAG: helix-turn-helix domain-containing protein [Muribaculaceae bacterium]|nr:helix-turn-helix domain-containing protein [Muribaculaceae bacterium]
MAKMKLTTLNELNDSIWGPIGTPDRDEMESQLKEDLNAYLLGEAIKKARQAQELTQEQLGARVGVQKSQISKLEKGKSVITLPTISRVFRALGVQTATLDLGVQGKVTLW